MAMPFSCICGWGLKSSVKLGSAGSPARNRSRVPLLYGLRKRGDFWASYPQMPAVFESKPPPFENRKWWGTPPIGRLAFPGSGPNFVGRLYRNDPRDAFHDLLVLFGLP